MNVPELFGPAPTLEHDALVGTAQPYGSSSLPGAPTNETVSTTPVQIVADPTDTSGGNPSGGGTTGGTGATAPRHFAAPTGPATDVSGGGMLPATNGVVNQITIASPSSSAGGATSPTTTTPATADTPTTTAAAGADAIGRLIDLASAQNAGGGGGGGLVALPTGVVDAQSSSGGGISKATLLFLVAAIAIGVYFYSRHKKKNAGKGGEEKGEKKE